MGTLENQDITNTPENNRSRLSSLINNLEARVINPDLVLEDRTQETLHYIESILKTHPEIRTEVELAWIRQFSTHEGESLLDNLLEEFSPGTTLTSQPPQEKAGILDRILKDENVSTVKEGLEKSILSIASLVPGGSLFLFAISFAIEHTELKKFKNELLLTTLQTIAKFVEPDKGIKIVDFGKKVLDLSPAKAA